MSGMNSIPKPINSHKAGKRLLSFLIVVPAIMLATGIYGADNASRAAGAVPALKSVLIRDVPHVRQKPDFCGEACAEMYLRKLGSSLTQDDVYNIAAVDPLLGRGCYTPELAAALEAIGFKTGTVSFPVNAANARAEIDRRFAELLADLARGIPSIVCMRTGAGAGSTEHFRLILGYDAGADAVIYHEPADADDGAYLEMPREEFVDLWPLRYNPNRWIVIRMRLEPCRVMPIAAPKKGFTSADYAQHMMGLKTRIPGNDFSAVIEPPFVVIGDEGRRVVKLHAEETVRWAVKRLKAAYFEKEPASIIDIWLFKDEDSYEKYAREIFNDEPSTPFGYSSSEHKALVMNIGTGGGTLVHEMVHAFMDADFPACPAWFNEGLASLYEQSSGDSTRIWGLTNWRLASLQKAIKEKRVSSFDMLIHTTRNEFYNEDRGINYAQARYLCYYLQENGLLRKYYRLFKAGRAKDPTGYDTLKAVLGEKDMAAFQKKWEKFVLGLRFP